jgi:putative membrane protein
MREPAVLLLIAVAAIVISGIGAYEQGTWLLEVAPALIAGPILIATYRRFPLTPLAYRLLCLHTLILCLGGHYTYARVPLGFWIQDAFGLARNHYDRIGHLAQGFVPAIIAREVLLRTSPLRRSKWLFFLVCCICLAGSAFYEFIEWWAALVGGDSAAAFLGTQGDQWDTQADMLMALIGAILAQLTLSGIHDRELRVLEKE